MQTSETGADTGSTVTLQTSVASQAAVPTQVVQQVPVQQQVRTMASRQVVFLLSSKEADFIVMRNLLSCFLEDGDGHSTLLGQLGKHFLGISRVYQVLFLLNCRANGAYVQTIFLFEEFLSLKRM